jgi:glutathionylspermidine synthase
MKEVMLQQFPKEEVVLLEIYPDQQKTRIDFKCTKDFVGIETICLTALRADGRKLYYENGEGQRQYISRIYNRVIFDDLEKQELPAGTINMLEDWDVSWCPHPHWFYRISKYTLPLIKSKYVPETHFLHELNPLPQNLLDYVLKPLFSFAGQGVIIDVTKADVDAVTDPHNWILQKKVTYADAIVTPDVPAKAEIRIFYFWPKGAERPIAVQNLARLSKGKMIGVRYNADKEWVGGSLVFFEQ